MTRKDYIRIAAALKNAKPENLAVDFHEATAYTAWVACCYGLSHTLAQDNARFDRERFLTACGVN